MAEECTCVICEAMSSVAMNEGRGVTACLNYLALGVVLGQTFKEGVVDMLCRTHKPQFASALEVASKHIDSQVPGGRRGDA